MLVTLGHCNTSAMNVSVLHLVFEPAPLENIEMCYFVINLHAARLLGVEVPPTLLAIATEVIE